MGEIINIEEDSDGTETETEEAPRDIEEAKAKLQRTLSEVSTVVSGADEVAEFQRALSEVSTVVSAADEVAKLQRTLSEVSTATSGSLFGDSKVIEEELEMLRQEKAAIDERKAAIEMKIRKVSKNLRQLKRGQPRPSKPILPPGIRTTPGGTWINTPETRHIPGTTELPTIRHSNGDSQEVERLVTDNITQASDLGEGSTPRG